MPIAQIQFVARGGNQLLQNVLNRQAVSLSGALASAVQLNRDSANLQANQERATLFETRAERTFREGQFRDRRDFSRNVFVQDRAFDENVRQFNETDANADATRSLNAELGRGRLDIARQGLGLEAQRTALAVRAGEQQFALNDINLERQRSNVELRRQAGLPLPTDADERAAFGRRLAVSGDAGLVNFAEGEGLLPNRVRIDPEAAAERLGIAALRLQSGDLDEAEILANQAAREFPDDSPEQARALVVLKQVQEKKSARAAEAERAAAASPQALAAANEARLLVETDQPNRTNRNAAFTGSFEQERAKALASRSRAAYASEGRTSDDQKKRAKFYDLVRKTTPESVDKSNTDPNARYLREATND